MQNKQYDQAVQALTKASEVDPTQPAVWAQLGDAYAGLAASKTGAEFDANMQKGARCLCQGDRTEARRCRRAQQLRAGAGQGQEVPRNAGRTEEGRAISILPGAGKYYYNLGALLVNSGQSDAGGDAFKKAIEANPNYADAYYQYGVSLVSKAAIGADGKISPVPGTVEAFQKYLELQPTGQFAQPSKEMLATLGSSVETKFQNPNAPKGNTAPSKKKK